MHRRSEAERAVDQGTRQEERINARVYRKEHGRRWARNLWGYAREITGAEVLGRDAARMLPRGMGGS
jgi:hypothetical protein